ncbi:helix-turn-helix transcriptional regulator [Streptomyces sp. SID14478]|uniref:helix-turn-helix domain-containing protein n=1 Tax=Streptomyces sp. SID14478 TaxID=2706073 RepID=UPI0013D91911|nr:helix-turn-helix transcriptional regulator [Streptomyces sp. SID14478]NEB75265.1 helix-turn-helix transcriptional regulator [Streptomyces sp. SID14478]
MTTVDSAETVSPARRHVGALIKYFRTQAALTQKELAERLLVSVSTESAYECGDRIPTSSFLADADQLLDVGGALESCIPLMEEEKYPPTFVGWVRLEKKAAVINAYESMVFPGLLQTEEYTQALYESAVPRLPDDQIEKDVQGRVERQAILRRVPVPNFGYVIEESVLTRAIGGRSVLRDQLLHVLALSRSMSNLMLQVMPTDRPRHAGLAGSMQLLSTLEGRNYAYADGQVAGRLITKPGEVAQCLDRFGMLRGQALNPWESADLIERTAGRL